MPVGLFVPCFVDLLYPEVGVATVTLLERLGLEIAYPPEQTCCGQAHFNAGRRGEARRLAERFCKVFAPFDTIVCPSGSCTAMVREHYPSLVGDDPVCGKVFELCEYLTGPMALSGVAAELKGRAVLHVGCHGLRTIDIGPPARRLMEQVDGLSWVSVPSERWCCGFGGTFSVKFPEISVRMAERKLEPILAADVDYVVSTDSSCLMHLGGLLARQRLNRPRLVHVAEVLAGTVKVP